MTEGLTGGCHPTPGQYPLALAKGELSFHLPPPVPYEHNPILRATDQQDFPDGAHYISVMPAEGVLPNPIDRLYAYVASHDGTEIWLATAPHPLGPWSWRTCILHVDDTSFVGHISSPSAVFHQGEVYLYFHGSLPIPGDAPPRPQPTALATSVDGVVFKERLCPVIPTHPNKMNSWYGLSTSYARVLKDGGLFVATFQGNGFASNDQVGGVTTVVGLAMSEDGIRWRVARRPLMANGVGRRGAFGPVLVPFGNRWMLLYDDKGRPVIGGAVSEGADILGPYEPIGPVIEATGEVSMMDWPFPVFFERTLYLLYAAGIKRQFTIHASIVDGGRL